MNKNQLVSIIITCNPFDKSYSCLCSMLAQTYTNLEILVINTGSRALPKNFSEKMIQNSRIQYNRLAHCGLSAARNYGLKKARGEYILFMDGNDALDKRGIELLMTACDCGEGGKLPDMVLFGGHLYKKGSYLEDRRPTSFKGKQREFVRQPFYKCYQQGLIQPLWNKLLRRDFLLEHDVYFAEDSSGLEELLFSVQAIAQAQEIVVLDQALCHHYNARKPIRQSNSCKEETLLQVCQMILEMAPLHPRHRDFYCKDTVMQIIQQLKGSRKLPSSPLKRYRRVKRVLQNQQFYSILQEAVGDNRREKQKIKLLKLLMRFTRNKAIL